MDKRKLQLLIDAENLSPRYLEVILAEAPKYGEIVEKRIYGDWVGSNKKPWKEVLIQNSIVPVQQCEVESAITMDALDITGETAVDGLILAAYDSDFTKLVWKLKAAGKIVVGMGDAITPTAYINACETFVFLDVMVGTGRANDATKVNDALCATAAETEVLEKEAKVAIDMMEATDDASTVSLVDVEKYTCELLEKEENCGKILVGTLMIELMQQFPGFSHKKFGYGKFTQFIESMESFGIIAMASQYELAFPRMYVVSREYAETVRNQADMTDAEDHPWIMESVSAMSLEEVEREIIDIIDTEGCNGALNLREVRYSLKGRHPEFEQKTYGRKKFNKFMEMLSGVRLEMRETGNGQAPELFAVKK